MTVAWLVLLHLSIRAQNQFSGISKIELVYSYSSKIEQVSDTLVCEYSNSFPLDTPCALVMPSVVTHIVRALLEDSLCTSTNSLFSRYSTQSILQTDAMSQLPKRRFKRIRGYLERNDQARLNAISSLTGERALSFRRRLSACIRFNSGRSLCFESHSQFPLWLPWMIDSHACYSVDLSELVLQLFKTNAHIFRKTATEERFAFERLLVEQLESLSKSNQHPR